ncbi:CPLD59 [Auxenochlorella protothecoides x Auxenochlorella symbiontica]
MSPCTSQTAHNVQIGGRMSARPPPPIHQTAPCRRMHEPLVNLSLPRVASWTAALMVAASLQASPAHAGSNQRLPPLDSDPLRCERAFTGNTIGQANAVSDKILDLRFCSFPGAELKGKVLSGALLLNADLSGAQMQEVVMSKAYAVGTNFKGADLTSSVVDRVDFDGANLTGTKFTNAVITGATFKGANLDGASFEDALIGSEDVRRLCAEPSLTGDSRVQVGCRGSG